MKEIFENHYDFEVFKKEIEDNLEFEIKLKNITYRVFKKDDKYVYGFYEFQDFVDMFNKDSKDKNKKYIPYDEFVKKVYQNNPNIIYAVLFFDEVTDYNGKFAQLRDIVPDMLYTGLFTSFVGYAQGNYYKVKNANADHTKFMRLLKVVNKYPAETYISEIKTTILTSLNLKSNNNEISLYKGFSFPENIKILELQKRVDKVLKLNEPEVLDEMKSTALEMLLVVKSLISDNISILKDKIEQDLKNMLSLDFEKTFNELLNEVNELFKVTKLKSSPNSEARDRLLKGSSTIKEDIKEIAQRNKILEIQNGSYLYGTNTPSSDMDYVGIFLPDEDILSGINQCFEVDLSFIAKQEGSQKNSKDAIDRKLYEFRNYILLATENNPNILEMLFVNEENITFVNEIGRELLQNRHLFPNKRLHKTFSAYAFSQEKKMLVKKEHLFQLEEAQKYLEGKNPEEYMLSLKEEETFKKLFEEKYPNLAVGDTQVPANVKIKEVLKAIGERIGNKTHRKELIRKYAYDTKFGSHLIRLYYEDISFNKTGEIVFPLMERELIKNIKVGKYSLEYVLELAKDLKQESDEVFMKSVLPDNPDLDKINELCMRITKKGC